MTKISAGLNLAARRFALMCAKEYLPEEKYNEIKKSYNSLMKRTATFVIICCIPVIIVFLLLAFNTPFSKKMEIDATSDGVTEYVMARIDHDGNFY